MKNLLLIFWVFAYIARRLNSIHYESWENEVHQDTQENTKNILNVASENSWR